MNPLIIEMEENVVGNDYVIGDLHGCYYELIKLMEFVSFDKDKDRIFCVGDLIHRGPNSIKCIELLTKKNKYGKQWFYSVVGNHDHLDKQKIFINTNGYVNFNEEQKKLINSLPYIYVINHSVFGYYTVLHGELDFDMIFKGNSYTKKEKLYSMIYEDLTIDINYLLKNKTIYLNENQKQDLIWSRKIFRYFNQEKRNQIKTGNFSFLNDNNKSEKIKIFCGHNIVPFPMTIGHQIYCDTGACFGYYDENKIKIFSEWGGEFFSLSMIEVNTGIVYSCVSSEQSTPIISSQDDEYHIYKRGDVLVMDKPLYKGIK